MTFRERTYVGQDGKVKGYRKAENAKGARALWADFDAGPGKPYRDRDAILQALADRLSDLEFSLLMSSGGGAHGYIVTDELVPIDLWRELGRALANLFEARGLHADRQCTTNPVCWLRPSRTYNLKTGAPRLVEAIHQPLHVYRVADVEAILAPYKPRKRRRRTIAPSDVGDPLLLAELAHSGALGTVDDRYYWVTALHGIMRSCGYDRDKALPLADALSMYGADYEGTEDVAGRLDGIKDRAGDGPTLDTVRLWGCRNALWLAYTQAVGVKTSAAFDSIKLDNAPLDAGLDQPRKTITSAHATPLNAQRALYLLLRWFPFELEGLALNALRPFQDEMNRLRAAYWARERSHGPLAALDALQLEATGLMARDPALALDLAHWLTAWLAGLGWPKDVVVLAGKDMGLDEVDATQWAQRKRLAPSERSEAGKA
jgi:hypothetical protein